MSPWIETISKTLTNEKPSRRHALQAMGGFRCLLVVLLSLLALAPQSGHPNPAVAATLKSYTFTVTTTHDTHDAHPGDGVCADQKGQCSLRAAIEESDALPSGSSITITVPSGTYGLMLGTLALTTNTITINGAGHTTTLIKGNHTFGIMSIAATGSATLSQLTLEGGQAQHGGGIVNSGMLTLSASTVSNNTATYGGGGIWNDSGTLSLSNTSMVSGNRATYGGGIKNDGGKLNLSNSMVSTNTAGHNGGGIFNGYPSGTVSVIKSTVSGNTAGNYGGGIFNGPGTVTVNSSTLSNNYADVFGGGIENDYGTLSVSTSTLSGNSANVCCYGDGGGIGNEGGTLTVSSSTFSGNSANQGGGIYNYHGTLSITNSTLSGNSASDYGGGIVNYAAPVTLTGTIVANSPKGSNCSGGISDGGSNLDSGTSCGFTNHALNKTDPKLGPLRDNGGPTQTMALLKGSKAIGWVNKLKDCLSTDQRGYQRPDDSEHACDIGAYESAY